MYMDSHFILFTEFSLCFSGKIIQTSNASQGGCQLLHLFSDYGFKATGEEEKDTHIRTTHVHSLIRP